jgi:hypothetical protein
MTTGYLWTGQFEEAKLAIEEGRPQSMELDEETLDGHWSTNSKTGMEFFIINDAIFSKLCILGEDVEPCFEGARITAPEVSKQFTKMDDEFKRTLFTMMQDLKSALQGGYKMELEDKNVETEVTTAVEENVEETTEVVEEAPIVEEEAAPAENIEENDSIEAAVEENAEEVNEEESAEDTIEAEAETVEEEVPVEEETVSEETEEVKDYALIEQELEELKTKYAEMETKYQELVTFKEAVDNEKKDALINSFYMLSDEDKKDVIENKEKYSLEEIEAKLSVICVRNKVNFDSEDSSKNEDKVESQATTYTLESDTVATPAWLAALKSNRDNNK